MSLKPTKRERTHARLQACALELFEQKGFETTTVAEIAEASGVTTMTFFRHFSTKARALMDDPYDPLIGDAVGQQPRAAGPLARTVAGLRVAWASLQEPSSDVQRRRIRLVASTPSLWGEMHAGNRLTEDVIVSQLIADGTDAPSARVAAAAVLAAVTVALFQWAGEGDGTIGDAVTRALDVLAGKG